MKPLTTANIRRSKIKIKSSSRFDGLGSYVRIPRKDGNIILGYQAIPKRDRARMETSRKTWVNRGTLTILTSSLRPHETVSHFCRIRRVSVGSRIETTTIWSINFPLLTHKRYVKTVINIFLIRYEMIQKYRENPALLANAAIKWKYKMLHYCSLTKPSKSNEILYWHQGPVVPKLWGEFRSHT